MVKRKNNKLGFTLIEVIVAMSIISIIVFGLYATINTAIKVSNKNEQDINALQLVQSEVEKLRLQIKDGLTTFSLEDKDKNDVTINLGEKASYKKNINNKIYDVEVELSMDSDSQLYKIVVKTQLENINKNKKQTKIVTEIFGG